MAYNLFASDKQRNYPGYQQPAVQQPDFASDKAANYPGTQQATQPVMQPAQQFVPPRNTNNPVNVPVTSKPPVVDPTSPTSGMDFVSSMLTSPEQEEKIRKASIANQRIMAVADALRHIGNIYHTVNYSPSQQFNSPVVDASARYEKGKAVRDAANLKYYTYQQAKAAQDAKQKQWEADYNLKIADAARKAGYTEAQIKAMQDRLAQQKAYQQGQLALGQRRADDAKALGEAKLKQQTKYQNTMAGIAARNAATNERRATAYINRQNGGGGSGVAPLDTPKGRITPNGRNYSNQIEQIWSFAEEKKLVKESDVEKQLRTLGLGKDKSADIRHQMVLDLLRTNQSVGDYAVDRLGWNYSGGSAATNWDQYADDDEEENWNEYLDQ